MTHDTRESIRCRPVWRLLQWQPRLVYHALLKINQTRCLFFKHFYSFETDYTHTLHRITTRQCHLVLVNLFAPLNHWSGTKCDITRHSSHAWLGRQRWSPYVRFAKDRCLAAAVTKSLHVVTMWRYNRVYEQCTNKCLYRFYSVPWPEARFSVTCQHVQGSCWLLARWDLEMYRWYYS